MYGTVNGWKAGAMGGFCGGSVVGNPPANTAEISLIPGPGRIHMPQNNWAAVPQLLSLCSTASNCWAHMLQWLKLGLSRAYASQMERAPQWEVCALQLQSRPHSPQLEKNPCSNKDPAQPKINTCNYFSKKKIIKINKQTVLGKLDSYTQKNGTGPFSYTLSLMK